MWVWLSGIFAVLGRFAGRLFPSIGYHLGTLGGRQIIAMWAVTILLPAVLILVLKTVLIALFGFAMSFVLESQLQGVSLSLVGPAAYLADKLRLVASLSVIGSACLTAFVLRLIKI